MATDIKLIHAQEFFKSLSIEKKAALLAADNRYDQVLKTQSIQLKDLLVWLQEIEIEKEKLLQESLYSALLKDLSDSLGIVEHKAPEATSTDKAIYVLLAIAGTVFYACEGFESITSLLILAHPPAAVVFAIGLAFSLISLIVFYGFDLRQIAQNLGVKKEEVPELMDVYIQQLNQIQTLGKHLGDKICEDTEGVSLEESKSLLLALTTKLESLKKEKVLIDQLKNQGIVYWGKKITAVLSGILFFGGGYATGSYSAIILFGLVLGTVAPTFWPVIAISLAVGIAYVALYWWGERPSIENFISRKMGVDNEKMDKISEGIGETEKKLAEVRSVLNLSSAHVESLKTQNKKLEDLTLTHSESLKSHGLFSTAKNFSGPSSKSNAHINYWGETPRPDPRSSASPSQMVL